jgi:D-alanyl-D-alanine dipeptidase
MACMVDKIVNRSYFILFTVIIFLTVYALPVLAQQPQVISRYKTYLVLAKNDSLKRMVDLRTIMPKARIDLRYGTLNNFMNERLYEQSATSYLRLKVARALAQAEQEFQSKNLEIKIWDAYRPYAVTVRMWQLIHDDRYVADPAKGSGHNRGVAVDLTLVNSNTGEELDMGTSFDDFTDTAHSNFIQLPTIVLKNRELLKTTMEKFGFIQLPTEWWHFYWKESAAYELLDIPFKKFRKKTFRP